jgi:cysteine sulfinate desulfinase/cysteine desulfurase-like protein
LQDYLSKNYIYISTQTACASEKSFSETIKRLTGSDLYAETSVRISLSHMTAMSEIDVLIKKIKEAINK